MFSNPMAGSLRGLRRIAAALCTVTGVMGAAVLLPVQAQAQTATPTAADIAAGKGLYAQWCGSCHGGVPASTDKWRVHYGTSQVMIESAISRFPMMAPLAGNLSVASMTQIAAYIADTSSTTGAGGGGSTTPATPQQALYNQYCGGCHGASPYAGQARVNLGTTAGAIQSAINGFAVMRTATLQGLTATQLADIATFIADDVATKGAASSAGSTPNAQERGRTAYDTMCASCHGANPASGHNDIDKATSAARTMGAIASNKGGMGKFSFLTTAQAEDIAVYVASTNPSGEGGCTMAAIDRPTDPVWPLMVGGAMLVLLRRRLRGAER